MQFNKYIHTHTHRLRRRQAAWRKLRRKEKAHIPQWTYPLNVWASCRSVRRQPGALGLSVQVFNVNRHRSDHSAPNHPRRQPSPIRRPKPIYSSSARYVHVKTSTGVQLPVLQPTNARFTSGRGLAYLKNLRGRYKRHATLIDMIPATSAATFTPNSAATRVGAIKHTH